MNLLRRDKIYRRINVVIIAIFLLALGIYLFNRYSGPSSIGEFEYIGKSEAGCIIPICSMPPYAEYYFATDMTGEQLAEYIGEHATLIKEGEPEHYLGYYSSDFVFKNIHKNEEFVVTLYDAGASQHLNQKYGTRQFSKSFLIGVGQYVDDERGDFVLFRDALKDVQK